MKKHYILISLSILLVLGTFTLFIGATSKSKNELKEPDRSEKLNINSIKNSKTAKSEKVVKNLKISGDTIELGKVAWLRNYEEAVQLSKEHNKPILILFQEVPGCLTCQRFGREVMSNPLIVDVIEHRFIPLCIFNNKKGSDAQVLNQFNEPSWNNPVVRIINSEGKDITNRMGSFHPKEIIAGISEALEVSEQEIPLYFELLEKQIAAEYGKTETATFPMHCFWAGELKLGQIEGVVNTKPGFMNGREVVEITFDANKVSYKEVLKSAKNLQAIDGAFVEDDEQTKVAKEVFGKSLAIGDFRVDKEPKYYMSNTIYKHIPMLPLQRIQVNEALYNRQNPQKYLSPSQIEFYEKIKKMKMNINLPDYSLSKDIVDDWQDLENKVAL